MGTSHGLKPSGSGDAYEFSSYHPNVVQFCLADGSVRAITVQITENPVLRSVSGMTERRPVEWDKL